MSAYSHTYTHTHTHHNRYGKLLFCVSNERWGKGDRKIWETEKAQEAKWTVRMRGATANMMNLFFTAYPHCRIKLIFWTQKCAYFDVAINWVLSFVFTVSQIRSINQFQWDSRYKVQKIPPLFFLVLYVKMVINLMYGFFTVLFV